MSLSHAIDTFPSSLCAAYDQLQKVVELNRSNAQQGESFEQIESVVHEAFMTVERAALTDIVAQYDINLPGLEIDNQAYRQVGRYQQTYCTAVGDIQVERSLYRNKARTHTICPLELGAGIVEKRWSPRAAKQALHVVSQLTPYEAENLFAELGAMTPSKSSLDRLPKKLGSQWEKKRSQFEMLLREQREIPATAVAIGVSLDGVLIPMQGGRILPGDSRYEEASCGAITYYDEAGEPLLTRRHGCMPEHKKKTMKFFLKEEVEHALQQQPELQLIKVADGARDNWTFLDDELPEGLSVLDFYHAAEHLKKAFDLAYPKDSIKASVEFSRYRSLLRHDTEGVNKVIRHLGHLVKKNPKKALLLTELNYFKNNKARCRYADIAGNNLPIGSGIVEATCKTLVTQRLKRSGMCWGEDGGQSIMTFRALLQSQLFDEAWMMLSAEYKIDITLSDNVVLFRKRS